MAEHSAGRGGREAAARRAVSFWYRMGLARADAQPPRACAHAYDLGRRMAGLRPLGDREPRDFGDPFLAMDRAAGRPACPYCDGTGEVSGVVDDLEFTFQCPCAGGRAEPVRWLLGSEWEAPAGDDWSI